MTDSGIYQIENQVNGNRYIGSAVSLRHRQYRHLCDLRHGRHGNQHLQRAFDKYGETAFVFSVLEDVEDALQLLLREQHYLDTLKPEYNIESIAGSPLGVRRSAETRRNISEARASQRATEETRRILSAAHKGVKLSERHRKAISEARKGVPRSAATKRRISEGQKAFWARRKAVTV